MMSRAFRPIAATLAILLLSGVPTHAAPVAISQVIQVIGSYQNPPELRLRSVSQNTSSLVDEGNGPSPVALLAAVSSHDRPSISFRGVMRSLAESVPKASMA